MNMKHKHRTKRSPVVEQMHQVDQDQEWLVLGELNLWAGHGHRLRVKKETAKVTLCDTYPEKQGAPEGRGL